MLRFVNIVSVPCMCVMCVCMLCDRNLFQRKQICHEWNEYEMKWAVFLFTYLKSKNSKSTANVELLIRSKHKVFFILFSIYFYSVLFVCIVSAIVFDSINIQFLSKWRLVFVCCVSLSLLFTINLQV